MKTLNNDELIAFTAWLTKATFTCPVCGSPHSLNNLQILEYQVQWLGTNHREVIITCTKPGCVGIMHQSTDYVIQRYRDR